MSNYLPDLICEVQSAIKSHPAPISLSSPVREVNTGNVGVVVGLQSPECPSLPWQFLVLWLQESGVVVDDIDDANACWVDVYQLELHRPTIEETVLNLLAAQEPCTLEQICDEIRLQSGVNAQKVLSIAIAAIAALQADNKICEYEQMPCDDPFDYAWVRSEEI